MIDFETKVQEGQLEGKVDGCSWCPIKCTPRIHDSGGDSAAVRFLCGLFNASASAFVRSKGVADKRKKKTERRRSVGMTKKQGFLLRE